MLANRESLTYNSTMYGENSSEYRMAELLTKFREILYEKNILSLYKNCKFETIIIEIKLNENNILINKKNIDKNNTIKKEKNLFNENINFPNNITAINKVINNYCYDYVLKGFSLKKN